MRFWIRLLLLALAIHGAPAASLKRVIILNPFARDTEPYTAAVAAFRTTLGREIRGPLAFEEIPLVAFLQERVKRQTADLVVPVGSSSVRFVDHHRVRLFPGVPILAIGVEPRLISPGFVAPAAPVYDWRELKRWNIPGLRLLAGSLVLFLEAGFWERYHWPVIGVMLLALLQAGLIIGLLVNRTKRRNREAEATLIAEISSKFINLPASGVDRVIYDAQRRICELMDIDIIVLWQWSDRHPGSFTATHFYSLQHGPQAPIALMDEDFPWVKQEILAGRMVVHRSLAEMPAAADRDREASRRAGVKSYVTLPLSLGGESPIGVLSFNTTRKERDWPPALVERLHLVAEIFANALARKKADHELHESEDRNRLAMEQTMELRESLAHAGRVTLLGQLASALAHELSQPLGAILRNAEAAELMLQQADPDLEELRAIIDDILRDDHRAGEVIDKLRSLLRKGHLDQQPLVLAEVIAEVLPLVRADATERQVKIIFDGESGLPPVLGDRIHLQQVLLNLIVNAMDACDGVASGDRAVRLRAGMADASTVEFSICDNGSGIADKDLGNLFEPFFTTKTTGMGMGLPVSRTIIEAHHGKLWAENRPEGGACFRFTLSAASHS